VIVHLIDGTYELFRHFYGLRRFTKGKDRPYGAVVGILQTVLNMIEQGDTYIGVATDRSIVILGSELTIYTPTRETQDDSLGQPTEYPAPTESNITGALSLNSEL
jgi:hypothetical protein